MLGNQAISISTIDALHELNHYPPTDKKEGYQIPDYWNFKYLPSNKTK